VIPCTYAGEAVWRQKFGIHIVRQDERIITMRSHTTCRTLSLCRNVMAVIAVVCGTGSALAGNHGDVVRCNAREPERAIAACTKVTRDAEAPARIRAAAFFRLGAIFQAKGDQDLAINHFSEAIRLDPKSAKSFKSRGDTYWQKKDDDNALADYAQAIELDPKDASTYVHRARIWAGRNNLDAAIADNSEAIRIDPKSAIAYSSRASNFEAKGDHERAMADYRQGIELLLTPDRPRPPARHAANSGARKHFASQSKRVARSCRSQQTARSQHGRHALAWRCCAPFDQRFMVAAQSATRCSLLRHTHARGTYRSAHAGSRTG
jgi:predicted Zn-dependent protease